MTHHQDIVQGGGVTVTVGWIVSVWTWMTAGMPPLAALATILTIILTALKIRDAMNKKRFRDTQRMGLDSRPHHHSE